MRSRRVQRDPTASFVCFDKSVARRCAFSSVAHERERMTFPAGKRGDSARDDRAVEASCDTPRESIVHQEHVCVVLVARLLLLLVWCTFSATRAEMAMTDVT